MASHLQGKLTSSAGEQGGVMGERPWKPAWQYIWVSQDGERKYQPCRAEEFAPVEFALGKPFSHTF